MVATMLCRLVILSPTAGHTQQQSEGCHLSAGSEGTLNVAVGQVDGAYQFVGVGHQLTFL